MINYMNDENLLDFLASEQGLYNQSPLDMLISLEELSEEESREAVEIYVHDMFINHISK